MKEKEKMKQGLLYDANYDDELLKDRISCKEQCFQYNQLRPSQIEEQEQLIRSLFKKTGKPFVLQHRFGVIMAIILK